MDWMKSTRIGEEREYTLKVIIKNKDFTKRNKIFREINNALVKIVQKHKVKGVKIEGYVKRPTILEDVNSGLIKFKS